MFSKRYRAGFGVEKTDTVALRNTPNPVPSLERRRNKRLWFFEKVSIVARCQPNETGSRKKGSACVRTAFASGPPLLQDATFSAAGAARAAHDSPFRPMPKKYRLSRTDFTKLADLRSKRVHGAHFSLAITPLPAGSGVKAACVVSKKVSPRAVDRNRIERRCREALRPLLPSLHSDVALVFSAKREAKETISSEIAHDVKALLGRAELGGTIGPQ